MKLVLWFQIKIISQVHSNSCFFPGSVDTRTVLTLWEMFCSWWHTWRVRGRDQRRRHAESSQRVNWGTVRSAGGRWWRMSPRCRQQPTMARLSCPQLWVTSGWWVTASPAVSQTRESATSLQTGLGDSRANKSPGICWTQIISFSGRRWSLWAKVKRRGTVNSTCLMVRGEFFNVSEKIN